MAGGGQRKPPATSSSSRAQKAWVPRGPGRGRSSESQEGGPSSSSPSVGSQKTPLQTVTPVRPPKSADSPPQVVTPGQPPKAADSPWKRVTPAEPVKSVDSPPQMVTSVQPQKSVDSPLQMVTPVQAPKSVDPAPQMVTPVQPPRSLDAAIRLAALFQPPKSLDSRSTSCGSGAAVSDSRADPFDICRGESKSSVLVQPSLLEINREKRRARELSKSAAALQHLRPGMVLLKNFLKPEDQVKIIKQCRDLGVGTGGFYQPSYRDGGKLSLRMMCLGKKNWDPDSCYGDRRPFDGAQPLKMPEEFTKFVNNAIEASHAFLKQSGQGTSNPKKEIPPMSPDICIVNFYTTAGKLGLHQDKDETIDSLHKKLPVVSFSVGDTAEFLYGDTRDETKASKVKLESGDVLIFGGQSRHIFHGVSSITPKTAPTFVTKEGNLRPGRLNLTFRQY